MVNPPAAETAINVRFFPAPFPTTGTLAHTNALSVLLLSSPSARSRLHAPFLRFRYLETLFLFEIIGRNNLLHWTILGLLQDLALSVEVPLHQYLP